MGFDALSAEEVPKMGLSFMLIILSLFPKAEKLNQITYVLYARTAIGVNQQNMILMDLING